MRVYVLCRRFVDRERNFESSRIVAVYKDPGEAYAKLDEKCEKGETHWYIVTKVLKEKEETT